MPVENHLKGPAMRFRFDGNQLYQQRAIASVVDLFQGVDRKATTTAFQVGFYSGEYEVPSFVFDDARLLANLRKVQEANRLPLDNELKKIEETVDLAGKKQTFAFPNFSTEMETGTGKTYV
jgi:type III restriction enzyme